MCFAGVTPGVRGRLGKILQYREIPIFVHSTNSRESCEGFQEAAAWSRITNSYLGVDAHPMRERMRWRLLSPHGLGNLRERMTYMYCWCNCLSLRESWPCGVCPGRVISAPRLSSMNIIFPCGKTHQLTSQAHVPTRATSWAG